MKNKNKMIKKLKQSKTMNNNRSKIIMNEINKLFEI